MAICMLQVSQLQQEKQEILRRCSALELDNANLQVRPWRSLLLPVSPHDALCPTLSLCAAHHFGLQLRL